MLVRLSLRLNPKNNNLIHNMTAAYPEYQGYNVSTGRHHTNIHTVSKRLRLKSQKYRNRYFAASGRIYF